MSNTLDLILTIIAALLVLAGSFKAGKVHEKKKVITALYGEIARSVRNDGEGTHK